MLDSSVRPTAWINPLYVVGMQRKAFNLLLHSQNGNIYRNLNTCIFIQLEAECVLCTADAEDWIQSLVVYYFLLFFLFLKKNLSLQNSLGSIRGVYFSMCSIIFKNYSWHLAGVQRSRVSEISDCVVSTDQWKRW